MMNLEDTIEAFWCCTQIPPICSKCPTHGPTGQLGRACKFDVKESTYHYLKAQEPHLLTLDEIHDSMVVYLEAGTKFLKRMDDDGVVLAIGGSERIGAKCFITVWDVGIAAMNDEYNVTWRAWSQRPTKEQREGTPWN